MQTSDSYASLKKKLLDQGIRKLSRVLRESPGYEEKESITAEDLKAGMKKVNSSLTDSEIDEFVASFVQEKGNQTINVIEVLETLRVAQVLRGKTKLQTPEHCRQGISQAGQKAHGVHSSL